jgi:hypothetical protein
VSVRPVVKRRVGLRVRLPIVLVVVLGAPSGFAQTLEGPIGGVKRDKASPQNFAAEIRFAPFTPDIDSDPSLQGATPFATTFGSGPSLLVSAEFDWQALRIPHLGSLGPGVGAGYTKFSGPAQFVTEHNGTFISGEDTSLEIYPFYGVLVFRADAIWRELRVPLVPYAKAGVGYALWRASNTLGTSHSQGVVGLGHSLGSHVALGLALNLNPFDEYAAKTFDDSMGVNSTSLFAEWTREDLDGLGLQPKPLRVGGTSWTFGLAFEF